jgi:poly(3-hydroxybutyrate) depolymerase
VSFARSSGFPEALQGLRDLQRLTLRPAVTWAGMLGRLLCQDGSPAPVRGIGRLGTAASVVLDDLLRDRGRPDWALRLGGPVAQEAVRETPFCRLVRFVPPGGAARGPKLLLVVPLSGHHPTLLRDTVAALLPRHEVFATEWCDASDIPAAAGRFGLDEYVAELIECIRRIGPGTSLVAVCQPAPLALAATAIMAAAGDPAVPAAMVLMGGPVDARAAATMPTRIAEARPLDWFGAHCIATVPEGRAGAGRRIYPGLLQLTGFVALDPVRHLRAHLDALRNIAIGREEHAARHRAFYDDYFAVMDVPAEYYIETIDVVFQRHLLATGAFRWRGRPVRPAAINRTSLLTIEGEQDTISAPGQTAAAHALCAGIPPDRRAHLLQPGVGHCGIFSGRRWREEIAPRIGDFVAQAAATPGRRQRPRIS